jgi:hypothetical protein
MFLLSFQFIQISLNMLSPSFPYDMDICWTKDEMVSPMVFQGLRKIQETETLSHPQHLQHPGTFCI